MNIGVVYFTNERSYDLTSLTVPYYLENSKELPYPVHIVSNRLPKTIHKISNVEYFDAGVDFSPQGSHFSATLRNFLIKNSYKYILFFCDDYLVKSPIKGTIFNQLLSNITEYNISKLHLGTLKHLVGSFKNWNKHIKENYTLVEIDKNYRHTLSVQPCIWNTEHLLEILNNNPFLSLHDLDNSNIKDQNGKYRNLQDNQEFYYDTGFTHYTHNHYGIYSGVTSYHVDERPMNSDYLVLDYIEFIRHGKILEADMNSKKHILAILEQNNFKEQFKHYM